MTSRGSKRVFSFRSSKDNAIVVNNPRTSNTDCFFFASQQVHLKGGDWSARRDLSKKQQQLETRTWIVSNFCFGLVRVSPNSVLGRDETARKRHMTLSRGKLTSLPMLRGTILQARCKRVQPLEALVARGRHVA